jgi:hypothetical protein
MSCFLGASLLGGWDATADNLFGSDEGKFLLTAGFNDLEGSGGGGLVPLAFISGYGSSDSWGANAHFTNIQLNAVVRATKANEFGLLGFGGTLKNTYSYKPEGTVAYLLTRHLAVGSEIRTRPHNLSVDDESSAYTVFLGWTPTKNISLVAAYLNIGSVLGPVTGVNRHQDGPYISVQAGF